MYLRACGSFKSANHKKFGLQIANPQSVTFAEGHANLTNYTVYCRLAICGSYMRILCQILQHGT